MTGFVIFDFDGTLADTSEGIVKTVQTTLAAMGLPQQPVAQIKSTIGLPLSETIRLGGCVPEGRVEEGVKIYRETFFSVATGHIKLFPGVKETLLEMHSAGIRLAIATSRGSNSLGGYSRPTASTASSTRWRRVPTTTSPSPLRKWFSS